VADEVADLHAGGQLSTAVASRLLAGLAAGCRQLEVLELLPEPLSGLGDEHMVLLAGLTDLKVGGWGAGCWEAAALVADGSWLVGCGTPHVALPTSGDLLR
jgi:hypothetical protein